MIKSYNSTMGFFRETIKKALAEKNIHIQESTEFYIVNLLSTLTKLESDQTAQTIRKETPLALLYANACEAKNTFQKTQHFKILGDHALFVSGFYSDSLKEKVVDIDYYIGMGTQAYKTVSNLSSQAAFTQIFQELASKFHAVVDLLSQMSEEFQLGSDQDLLRLYDKWLMTKSRRLLQKLQDEGLDPFSAVDHGKSH